MEAQGWTRTEKTVSIAAANTWGLLVTLPVVIAFGVWFVLRHGTTVLGELSVIEIILIVVMYLGLIFVHEGLHGVTWACFAPEHFKQIEFGFIKQQLTPYCWCGAPLTKGRYLLGSMMPGLVLGVLPCTAACLLGWPAWLWLGELMLLGAAGDLLISLKLLGCGGRGKELCCLDHPTECGLILFEKAIKK